MLQKIQGHTVYVLEITETLVLPITDGGDPQLTPYAEAATKAIYDGTIPGPGKYAIEIVDESYNVFDVLE